MINHRPSPYALRVIPLLVLCAVPFAVFAQTSTATLSGTVTDPNGALVSGVVVTVTDPATRLQRTTNTNDAGQFTLPLLPPSKYNVTLERQGFMTAAINDIVVNVNDERSLRIQLRVGDVKEVVNVTSEASLIDESTAVGTTVDRQFVANLPLNGRSFQSLIALTPGIVRTATNPNGIEPGQFSVNGQRANANVFMVDGVSANVSIEGGLVAGEQASGTLPALTVSGGTNNLVSVDALQEFTVQTSTYAAEFGRSPGGQISIATRSGTNDFHGTVFDYFRNEFFDANDWFNNANRQAKPATRQHDFGGVIGGPLFLPRFGEGPALYNGRGRIFFFFSYEGLRLQQPQAATMNVPSLSARQEAPPDVRTILRAYPLPTGPENTATRLAPVAASFSNPGTLNATSLRIDHTQGQKLTVFGRYNFAPSATVVRGGTNTLSNLTSIHSTTQTLTLASTVTFSERLINDVRFNYTRLNGTTVFDLDDFGGAVPAPDSVLFPSFASRETSVFNLLLSSIGPGNVFAVGSLADNLQRQINLVDNVSWIHQTHTFKFGVDYRRVMPVIAPRQYAQVNVASTMTPLLTGRTSFTQVQAESAIREPVFTNFSLYGQDTWKPSRRLTLSYGLRWEVNPAPHERNGNDPRTLTGLDNSTTAVLAPAGTPLYRTTYNNFAPRFGVAFQLREKPGRETVVRGGAGLFYDLGSGESSAAFAPGRFPYASVKTVVAPLFPLGTTDATPAPFSATPSNSSIVAFDEHLRLPYTFQYSFAIEQSLGSNQTISASYVGARGHRLLRSESFSTVPGFSSVRVVRNTAWSAYDSMQLQYQRRLSRGLQALVSYTFGKSLDTASSESTPFASVLRYDPQQDYGPSDFDVRHVFSGTITYDIPKARIAALPNVIFNNWSIDTIVTAQSAAPVNVTTGATLPGAPSTVARPDLVGGVPIYIDDPNAPGGRRINRNAFVAVPLVGGAPSRQGTLGRNALRGFPLFQIDLTLRRQFKLTERARLQFRTDIFNVLNHPNFAAPCSGFTDCTGAVPFGVSFRMFGRGLGAGGVSTGLNPLYQIGGPRSMQFSLKLEF